MPEMLPQTVGAGGGSRWRRTGSRVTSAGRSLWSAIRRSASAAKDLTLSTWPIIRREFVGLLRTRKAFWISVLTVAAASLFPLFAWPDPGSPMPYLSSFQAFMTYSWTLSAALFLFVPAVTAGAISGERERETYELLYNTLIRPSGIVIGKLVAATGFFLLLLVLTSPMVCILYLLGGFQFSTFLTSFSATAVSILYMSLVGLWCSMRNRRTYQALVASFAFLIIISILTSMLAGISMLILRGANPMVMYWVSHGVSIGVALLIFVSLLHRARFPDLPASRRQELKAVKTAQLRGAGKPPSRTWLTRIVLGPSREGIPDGWNPVLVNAIRSDVFGSAASRRKLFWGFAAVLALVLALYLFFSVQTGSWSEFNLVYPLIINTNLLIYSIALLVPGSSAASLASERELGKLDFLRSTLLTPWRILSGKLLACLFGASGLVILGALCCGLLFMFSLPFAESLGWKAGLSIAFLVSTGAVMLACATCGLLASALSKTTVGAAVLSYFLAALYLLIIPLLLSLAFEDEKVMSYLSPLLSFSFLTGRWPRDAVSLDFFATSLFVSLLLSGLTFLAAVVAFEQRCMRDP
jgi:ABC-type transport system involved in multi-copper enzyme maturation permease subunit